MMGDMARVKARLQADKEGRTATRTGAGTGSNAVDDMNRIKAGLAASRRER